LILDPNKFCTDDVCNDMTEYWQLDTKANKLNIHS